MSVKPDPRTLKEIGGRIAEARRLAGGMSQRELADLVGVTERSIAAYEAGTTGPWRLLPKIAEATGTSTAWLYHGDDAPLGNGIEVLLQQLQEGQAKILKELRSLKKVTP